ncbi:MAG TPA: hypothetical protein VIL74_03600 [Pyrinomonadaceae bacterium]
MLLIWIISIGCKNGSDSNNANIEGNIDISNNEISGEVFPANEVCFYADIPIAQKYNKVGRLWGKNDGVYIGPDFRYLCRPYPSERMTLFDDVIHKVKVTYDARGNRAEGAHTIYMEYKASTSYENSPRLEPLDQKYRKEALIPLFGEVVKKALKQPLSAKAIKKIQSGKAAARDRSSCEKVGNGFICIDNFQGVDSSFVELYIFASEAALKNHFEEQNGSTN